MSYGQGSFRRTSHLVLNHNRRSLPGKSSSILARLQVERLGLVSSGTTLRQVSLNDDALETMSSRQQNTPGLQTIHRTSKYHFTFSKIQ